MKLTTLVLFTLASLPSIGQMKADTTNAYSFDIRSELQQTEQSAWLVDRIYLSEGGTEQELTLEMRCSTCILDILDAGTDKDGKELFVIYINGDQVLRGLFEDIDGWTRTETRVERTLLQYQLDD